MIRHVMKDDSVIEDITGHVVRIHETPAVYALLDQVKRKEGQTHGTQKNPGRSRSMAGGT